MDELFEKCMALDRIGKSGMLRCLVCSILSLWIGFIRTPGAQAASPWAELAPDFEQAKISVPSSGLFSSEMLLFRISLSNYRVETLRALDFGERRMPVAKLCALGKAQLCINAHFFDEAGNPLGLLIHRGITLQPMHRGGRTLSGVFSVSRDSVRISPRSGFSGERVLEAVQSGPRLLQSKTRVSGVETNSRSRRSGVCIDSKNRLIIYIVSSGLLGLTLSELQSALLLPEVGCVDALNFDGGGSSQLHLSGRIPNSTSLHQPVTIPGRDDIPVALAIYWKEPSQSSSDPEEELDLPAQRK